MNTLSLNWRGHRDTDEPADQQQYINHDYPTVSHSFKSFTKCCSHLKPTFSDFTCFNSWLNFSLNSPTNHIVQYIASFPTKYLSDATILVKRHYLLRHLTYHNTVVRAQVKYNESQSEKTPKLIFRSIRILLKMAAH